MNRSQSHWDEGALEPEDIDHRMSAIRHAIETDSPEQGVLLLTDVIPEDEEPEPDPHTLAHSGGREAATAIAEVLLDTGHLHPDEVAEVLRLEFRRWLETDGRQVLAELLDELVEREEQQG